MPVLARLFEAAGMPTVLVTNMPFWSERVGAPRSLGVEFPFGHPADDRAMQRRVILTRSTAAIANATWHATGIRIRDLPITLDKLLLSPSTRPTDNLGSGRAG